MIQFYSFCGNGFVRFFRSNSFCVARSNFFLPAVGRGNIRRVVPGEAHHPVHPGYRRQTGESKRRQSGWSSELRQRSRGDRGRQAVYERSHGLRVHRPQRQTAQGGRLQRAVVRVHPSVHG